MGELCAMSLWNLFRPSKTADFFELMLEQAEMTNRCCKALLRFLEEEGEADEVLKFHREAKDVRRVLIDELNKTFITPIDREDIFAISRAIDDVADHAWNTVKEMEVFEVRTNEFLCKMAELLLMGSDLILSSIKRLEKNPNVSVEYAQRANRIESKMNDVYLSALKQLFSGGRPGVMLSYREIYRHFNRSADRVDEAADIISGIVVKSF